ncbi:MAG: hypothetical protein H6835_09365 [Planctomycetes bacterium]|nr:hypothetical protein [Planctomycetota bacterium]
MGNPTPNPLAALLALAAPAAAQIQPSATLVEARVRSGTVATTTPAAWIDVWSGLWRSVSGNSGSAALGIGNSFDAVEVGTQWQLSCAAFGSGLGEAFGDVNYLLDSPVLQQGAVVVEWATVTAGTGATTLAADVGGDGVVEANGAAVIPVTFGPGSLVVRVRAGVEAQAGTVNGPWGTSWSWNGSASAQLRVRFVATHATVTEVAAATCAPAPTMLARPDLWQGVTFDVAAPADAELALLVFGFDAASAPLPLSSGCTLAVAPAVVAVAPLLVGAATFALAVPPALRPASLLAQPIAFDVDAGPGVPQLAAGAAVAIDVD